jgi:hypothetical protein
VINIDLPAKSPIRSMVCPFTLHPRGPVKAQAAAPFAKLCAAFEFISRSRVGSGHCHCSCASQLSSQTRLNHIAFIL